MLTALVFQIIGGAFGGSAAGNLFKDGSLGPLGNTIVGAIGGALGGNVLGALLGLGSVTGAAGLDIGSILTTLTGGGASGGIAALVLSFLKSRLAG